MTRFVGDAKDVRDGRKRLFPSTKEMRKNMEIFRRTGRHPALEGSSADRLPPLPERDMNRPHVFLDVKQSKDSLGERQRSLLSVDPYPHLVQVCCACNFSTTAT
jgi:hypothetical protein